MGNNGGFREVKQSKAAFQQHHTNLETIDTNDTFIGINIGSIRVKVVEITSETVDITIINHKGRPVEVIGEFVKEDAYYGVSGYQGDISEVDAIERALGYYDRRFDAVVSLGGEAFMIYFLKGNHIRNVITQDRCAAGSGEFLVQQVSRLDLDLSDAIELGTTGSSIRLASRCSVHCKSDVTHKLNKKEAEIQDVLYSIHESMVKKIVALLEKAKEPLEHVLIIGGLAQNNLVVDLLRKSLQQIEVMVLPSSPYFEALGTALLVQDHPRYRKPQLHLKKLFSTLQPLSSQTHRVHTNFPEETGIVPSPTLMVLGVDGGSTTTKATLLDMQTKSIISSHYTRTNGDPISATKECINAIIKEVGDQEILLSATTGSARKIIGAYLGTSYIFNEISAHARGAAHYDPEVDTIFEIGGQDSKYIYLEHQVPVDYAMNSACSAGTGSFLEESASSDLGISVYDIERIALEATHPVQFKADCAAFINTDIRNALQEDYQSSDIIAGLVYSIATNYLTKVKGTRKVGRKIFFQGGVAKNAAVAHAFAAITNKDIILPPSPELMGAFGVALLALEHEKESKTQTSLLTELIQEELISKGSFTCRACENYCSIEKYIVGGRKFNFGGSCSKYENDSFRRDQIIEETDYVHRRNEIIFGVVKNQEGPFRGTIGIPKALTTHFLLPLYYTFFEQLHFQIVLSSTHEGGELRTNAPFCYPAQIAHGAIDNLITQGVDFIFLPQLAKMPHQSDEHSYLCPITQSTPYVIEKAFDQVKLLDPILDFQEGYSKSTALAELAHNQLQIPKEEAAQAYKSAVKKQLGAEHSMKLLGEEALALIQTTNKPAIILAGRSYNAFPADISQSIGKKLASMGYITVPHDCLPAETAEMPWYFSNLILNAAGLSSQVPNLYFLFITSFGCNIDAFTLEFLKQKLNNKPYLALEIDSHSADAGTQTRLEAFLDIINNHRVDHLGRSNQHFQAARILEHNGETYVLDSSNRLVSIRNPRVKIHLPAFSSYHSQVIAMVLRWMGLHAEEQVLPQHGLIDRGLEFTSGKECMPLAYSIGQLLKICEERAEGEIIGFYMLTGGAPCVVDVYADYFRTFIQEHELKDVFLFLPSLENNFCSLSKFDLARYIPTSILLGDIAIELDRALTTLAPQKVEQFQQLWTEFIDNSSKMNLDETLDRFVQGVTEIKYEGSIHDRPKVIVTGDFFVRLDPFFMAEIDKLYAEHGILLKPVGLEELLVYPVYDNMASAAVKLNTVPQTKKSLLLATGKCFKPEGLGYLGNLVGVKLLERTERNIRSKFEKTGLLFDHNNDLKSIYDNASDHIHPTIFGEGVLTIGKGVQAIDGEYDGIIVMGPLSCLPFKISASILKPLCMKTDTPLLIFETDGISTPKTFLRSVQVHIRQVLNRQNIKLKHMDKISLDH